MFAHSLGAVVCSCWLRQYGPASEIPPDELQFILIGSSIRPYGGFYPNNNWTQKDGKPFVRADLVAPIADTRYRVRDYALQYDGWCDWPADPGVEKALEKAKFGQYTYHLMYARFPLDRYDYRDHVEGNITYTLIPIKTRDSAKRRAEIELGHRRPEDA